jgi:hypothetical protein
MPMVTTSDADHSIDESFLGSIGIMGCVGCGELGQVEHQLEHLRKVICQLIQGYLTLVVVCLPHPRGENLH